MTLAISYNAWLAGSGLVTALLITYFFSPELQGVYFTIASLTALKAILDAGFSNVILSFVALNKSKVTFKQGKINFIEDGEYKLSNIYTYSIKRFRSVSIIGFIILQIVALFIFSEYINNYNVIFWILLSIVFCFNIFLTPKFCVIEGLNILKPLFSFRLRSSIINSILSWLTIILGGGVVCILVLNTSMLIQNLFFLKGYNIKIFKNFKFQLYDKKFISGVVSPMSFKIGASWASVYFTSNGIVPILFKYVNPVVAGQFGLSWSLLSVFSTVSKQFIIVIRPRLGELVSKKMWNNYYILFKNNFIKAIGSFLFFSFLSIIFILTFNNFQLVERLLSFENYLTLILLFLSSNILGYFTHFFRAQFKEPFYISYLLSSISLLLIIILNASSLNIELILFTIIISNIIFGFSNLIYHQKLFKKQYLKNSLE